MSSVADFLYTIADEIGRPRDSMLPIIKNLEENWYDTVESLSAIDDATYDQMKIPKRLVDLIKKKLGNGSNQQNKAAQSKSQDDNMMIEEPSAGKGQQKSEGSNKIVVFRDWFDQLKKETITSENLIESLVILSKITMNIIKDPKNEQFKTLKLFSNSKLKSTLGSFAAAVGLLKEVGFEEKDGVFILNDRKYNQSTFKNLNLQLEEYAEEASKRVFNPYQASFSSTSQVNMADFTKNAGSDLGSFPEKLEELKNKREAMIKPFIQNKDPQVIVIKGDQSINDAIRESNAERDDELPGDDELMFREEALRWAKQLEESMSFSSKRRKEFEELLKKPLFTETKIRIKFPNKTILEGRFSPKEPVKNVVEFLKEMLVDQTWNFHLYQSPPVQIITERSLNKTLEEYECVPSAIFYFGLEDKDQEANIKEFINIRNKQ